MKTKEELNALKKEVEMLNKKLAELTEEELAEVVGGRKWGDNWGEDGYFRADQEDSAVNQLKKPLRDPLKKPLRDPLK